MPPEERAEVVPLICEIMQSAFPLDVPLEVEVEVGPNWYDLEPA
jgi:DNA polymerase-1